MEDRIRELELKFTEQQETIEKLSEVVYEQQRSIDLLLSELKILTKKLEGEPGIVDAKETERPPHY